MKKKILIWSAVATAVILTTVMHALVFYHNRNPVSNANGMMASRVWFTADELLERSDLIIIGEPLKEITQESTVIHYIDRQYNGIQLYDNYYSLRDIKVLKVLKGEYSEENIQVRESLAGIINGRLITQSDYSVMIKGKKYILLFDTVRNIYIVSSQSKFNIDGKDPQEDEKLANTKKVTALKSEILTYFESEISEFR